MLSGLNLPEPTFNEEGFGGMLHNLLSGDNNSGLLALSLLSGNTNPLMMMALMGQEKEKPASPQQNQSNDFPTIDSLTGISSNDPIARLAASIKKYESSNNYSAMGPMTGRGDRAHGAYQIMGNNIAPWSKEALGYSVTPQQFLSDPKLQDRIALAKIGQYYNKYQNPQDVASMWFSGRPLRNNNSRDVLGTSVPKYARDVSAIFYGA